MTTADLQTKWSYLRDGAELGAMLTVAAREGMPELAAALRTLDVEQLEQVAFTLVLLHVDGAPLVDD